MGSMPLGLRLVAGCGIFKGMNLVQSLWIGPRLDEIQQLSIRSFLANGHDYHLFAYDHIDGVPDGVRLRDGASVLPRESIFCYAGGFGKGSFSAFSNLFRYELLCRDGGWWVDTDLVCLTPFAFTNQFVFATERDSDGTVYCATSAIACPPDADIMRYCADVAARSDRATLQWAQIGPLLLTQAVDQFGLRAYCVDADVFNPIDHFAFASLVQPCFDMNRLADSSAVHLWNQMWHHHQLNPTTAPPDSLYGVLRGRYLSDLGGSR